MNFKLSMKVEFINFQQPIIWLHFKKILKTIFPEYGGYCAWAIADSGKMVDVDPESFQILDGKLYLFYDSIFAHTLKKWQNNNPEKLKKIADKKWQNMR